MRLWQWWCRPCCCPFFHTRASQVTPVSLALPFLVSVVVPSVLTWSTYCLWWRLERSTRSITSFSFIHLIAVSTAVPPSLKLMTRGIKLGLRCLHSRCKAKCSCHWLKRAQATSLSITELCL